MEPVLREIDEVLATTRAVRRRLDLNRDVLDEVLLECIDLAEQAPTGANQSSRRWMVVRDPARKEALARLYRDAGGQFIIDAAEKVAGSGHPNEAVTLSGAYLAQHLGEVPAIVIPTIWGVHDNSGRPGLFDSVIQAAWSFCLALRARGLGTAWTTVHLGKASEVAELLGIPQGVTQIVLLPVAWTTGADFKPAPRRPAEEITYFDAWGNTLATRRGSSGPGQQSVRMADGPGVVGEIEIDAPRERVWQLVSDIGVPARFSSELQEAHWAEGCDGPRLGARFVGRNSHPAAGDWETTSYVVACATPKVFAWNVGDPQTPGASWRFELEPLHGGRTRLRQSVVLGPGPSGITMVIDAHPELEERVLARRRDEHRANIAATLAGIRALAETEEPTG
jgi:nitroreductase